MRYWKFSHKNKLKQKFFADSEKKVGIFFQDWDHSVFPNLKTLGAKWFPFLTGYFNSYTNGRNLQKLA